MGLEGKVALVIGASRGMGKQMALELAGEGADVVIAARTERPGQSETSGTIHQTAEEVRALGRKAVPVRVDLASSTEIEAMWAEALAAFGHVDVLVHSVQYMGPGYLSAFLDTTAEQLDTQLRVNLLSAMHATKLAAQHMKERGDGTIILISSAAAHLENPNMPGNGSTGLGYPTTKAGLNRFVRAVDKELRPHGVAVIAVDPGYTLSEHVREGATGDAYNGWPLEWAHGQEVPARTVRYLCTRADPMEHAGKVVVAEEFFREKGLAEG